MGYNGKVGLGEGGIFYAGAPREREGKGKRKKERRGSAESSGISAVLFSWADSGRRASRYILHSELGQVLPAHSWQLSGNLPGAAQ